MLYSRFDTGYTQIPLVLSTAQNGCQPKITAFDRAMTVNDTSELVADRDYTAVDGLVDSRSLHLLYTTDSVDSTGRTNDITHAF